MPPMEVEPNGTDVQMKDVSQESSVGATEAARKAAEENENDAIKAQLMADKHAVESNSPDLAVKAFTKGQEDTSSLQKAASTIPKDVSNPYRAAVKDLFDTHLNGNSASTHQQNRVLPSVEGSDRGTEIDSNRLTKDMLRLKSVLDEVSHKAAQNVLREKWRTFLFDPPDESHVAFVLRAGLKNSTPGILHRVIKDDNVFKPEFVDAAAQKPALRKRVLQTATAEELLLHMPAEALSAIVASTIATASVKVLVSWLAKGNRLGFEESDIQKGNSEIFSPNVFPQQQQPYSQASLPPAAQLYSRPVGPDAQINQRFPDPQHNHTLPSSSTFQTPHQPQSQQSHGSDALLAEQNRQRAIINNPAAMVCPDCKHQFTTMPGFQHHINKKPCNRPIPAEGYRIMCGNCLQGFTTKQGHDYHFLKRVCLGDDDSIHLNAPPAPPGFMPAPTIPSNDGLPAAHPSPNPYGTPTFPPRSPWAAQQNDRPQMPSRTPSFTPANGPQTIYPQPSAGTTTTSATKVKKEKKSAAERVDFTNASTPPTTRKQAPRAPDDVRIDPSQLPPEKLEALNRELAEVDARYDNGIADIPADWSEADKEARRIALKNANSSRKSQIRKTFGVTLRMREKDKQFKAARESMMRSGAEDSSPSASAHTSPAPQSAPPLRPVFDAARNNHQSPLVAAPVSGFSPVNAATRIVPPPPRYSPYTNGPSTNSSSANQSSGFTPRNNNNNGYSRLDMNVRQYHGPEPKTKPVDSKPASASTSGVNTPSSTSNPALKRRHEELEHEKRPASGQGGYTGPIPSLPSNVANGGDPHEKVKVHIAGAAVHDPSRPASPSRNGTRVIDLLDDDDEPTDVSAVVNLVNSASSRKAVAATESKSGDESEPTKGADGA